MKKWINGAYVEMTAEEMEDLSSGGVDITNPDEKETYPQKVFEYEWKDNYDIIDVAAIDYDTGVLTVSSVPEQITDDVTTTVRVFPSAKIEGYQTPFKYGKMPNEIMSTAGYYYAKKVGDNQITLCNPTTSEELSTITNSDVVDLTRWNLYVEKKRGQRINSVSIKNLVLSHKYRMVFYLPSGASGSNGINFYSTEGKTYGSGYQYGYKSYAAKPRESSNNMFDQMASLIVNSYETVSARGKYYVYSEAIFSRFPVVLMAEIYKINEQAFIIDSKVSYFAPETTKPENSTVFSVVNANNIVYLQCPYKTISFANGNNAVILDGSKCEVWDLGEGL